MMISWLLMIRLIRKKDLVTITDVEIDSVNLNGKQSVRSMQQQLGILGTISAFAWSQRKTKKTNRCQDGQTVAGPSGCSDDFQPAVQIAKDENTTTHLLLCSQTILNSSLDTRPAQQLVFCWEITESLCVQHNSAHSHWMCARMRGLIMLYHVVNILTTGLYSVKTGGYFPPQFCRTDRMFWCFDVLIWVLL